MQTEFRCEAVKLGSPQSIYEHMLYFEPTNKKMKKIIILLFCCALFGACSYNPSIEEIKYGIIDRESANIPLLLQRIDKVENIVIDSVVITQEVAPYAGYMITTWDIKAEPGSYFSKAVPAHSETVLVEIDSIIVEKDAFSWRSNWERAYFDVMF